MYLDPAYKYLLRNYPTPLMTRATVTATAPRISHGKDDTNGKGEIDRQGQKEWF